MGPCGLTASYLSQFSDSRSGEALHTSMSKGGSDARATVASKLILDQSERTPGLTFPRV